MRTSNGDSERSGFDFDEWLRLAKEDPDAFEARRDQLLREAIDQAPLHFRKKLHGLQFQVDMIRERSSHPLGACVRISNLMMDHLYREEYGVKAGASSAEGDPPANNNLIPFPTGGAGRRRL
ncbi:MAG: DUF3135 domain-containing protein [Sedimenticola sp.]|nr:DUF3135 domain-containing protein [Sedimenticola sp.]